MKFISIVFIICSSFLFAVERTGTSYFLNAGLNYNMHSTDIKGFSGTENCCDEFTGGNFIDPTFGFGMELSLGKLWFDMPTSYVLQINYNGMSSEYSEERFRGYKINEFDKDPIMVEHQLNPTIKLLSVGNSIYSELLNGFSFGVGADIGLAITSDFSQNEIALSPSDFLFSNGTREINTGEGAIEEMNSIVFSLFAGIRYDAYSFDNWTIRPELKYNYAPRSLLDGKDLNVSQISGSLSLVYHVTESTTPPPPPPMPEVKEPVVVEAIVPPHIDVKLEMKDNLGNEIKDGQKVEILTALYETRQEYSLRPVVFFDSSDYNYKQYNIQSFTKSDFDVQTELIKAVSEKMRADESLTITLTSYDIGDEDKEIPLKRNENIKQKLVEYGVPVSKITEKVKKVEDDFKYSELKNEYRKVDLNLSDNSVLIKSIYEIKSKVEYNDITFIPKSTITTTSDEVYDAESNLYLNGELTRNAELDFKFILGYANTKNFEKNGKLEVEYKSNAQVSGVYDDDKISFTLVPKIHTIDETINTVSNGSDISEQHILGYTEFDKSNFKSVDNDVLKLVRKAIKDNKKIIIYASTDNLGNEEYNKALAERRAEATKALIGSDNSNISIVYPKDYLFSNNHPYGRMLNRAIVIRIDS